MARLLFCLVEVGKLRGQSDGNVVCRQIARVCREVRKNGANTANMSRIGEERALQQRFEEALHAFDVGAAEALVRQALADGLSPAAICSQVIAPAMSHVEDHSSAGEITAGSEHLATGAAYRALDVVAEAARMETPKRRGRVLLTAARDEGDTADERDARDNGGHLERREDADALRLQMVAALLEGAGFDVLFPTTPLPPHALRALVTTQQPDVVIRATPEEDERVHLQAGDRAALHDVEDAVEAVEALIAR
jgi:B12 binding domain